MLGPGDEKAYSKDWNLLFDSGDPLPPGTYQLRAIIKASSTIESEPLDIKIQGHEQDIMLYKGWNFISLPCIPVYSDMSIILQSIWPYLESIWTYNAGTKSWIRYVAGNAYYLNNLKTMEIGKGYWVQVSEDVVLTIVGRFVQDPRIVLRPGLNVVGFSSAYAMPLDQAMWSIPYRSVHGYEDLTGEWTGQGKLAPTFLDGLTQLEPGKGYCIYVDSYCIWDVRNPN